MKPLRFTALMVTAVLTVLQPVGAGAVPTSSWRAAQRATLPRGAAGVANGYLPDLACASAGNCVAGGAYATANGDVEGFVLNKVAGTWRAPSTLEMPPNAGSNPDTTIFGVSCGAIGNCTAVGSYDDPNGDTLPFVDNEVGGTWHRAIELTLPANALGAGQDASVHDVACSAAGSCAVVGSYLDQTSPLSHNLGFVDNEVDDTWHAATEITLPSGANADPFVNAGQIACASAGNCTAVGSYVNANDVTVGMVVSEVRGTWNSAVALEPPANASAYAGTSITEVTCVKDGSCAVFGTYNDTTGAVQALVASNASGSWTGAIEVAMPQGAAANPHVLLYGYGGVSCASNGNCAIGGQYKTTSGELEGFLADEVSGVWGRAIEARLPAGARSAGANGGVVAVSCPRDGECRAGAAYLDAAGRYQALVIDETHGVWQRGTKVSLPDKATTVGAAGGLYALVCQSPNACTGVGSYETTATTFEGFTLAN